MEKLKSLHHNNSNSRWPTRDVVAQSLQIIRTQQPLRATRVRIGTRQATPFNAKMYLRHFNYSFLLLFHFILLNFSKKKWIKAIKEHINYADSNIQVASTSSNELQSFLQPVENMHQSLKVSESMILFRYMLFMAKFYKFEMRLTFFVLTFLVSSPSLK